MFRSKFSTEVCLIHLLDHIKGNNAKGLYTITIMLDLQKAFDTVDYVILCDSLVQVGVHPIVWSDKQQVINVNGVT